MFHASSPLTDRTVGYLKTSSQGKGLNGLRWCRLLTRTWSKVGQGRVNPPLPMEGESEGVPFRRDPFRTEEIDDLTNKITNVQTYVP